MSSDYKGDTSSALLEVLDSEQNNKFRDHYVEIPLDLSEVTVHCHGQRPADHTKAPSGPYGDHRDQQLYRKRKFHIGKEHLLKKQLDKHGLTADQLVLEDDALRGIIRHYTREAGVRGLERQIGKISEKRRDRFWKIMRRRSSWENGIWKSIWEKKKWSLTPSMNRMKSGL